MLDALLAIKWVVYSKPCLALTDTVIDYLGRYSQRIALSDRRLLDFDEEGNTVDVRYKDYRDGSRHKVMTLTDPVTVYLIPGDRRTTEENTLPNSPAQSDAILWPE